MATSILRRSAHVQASCQVANRLAWKPLAFPSEGFAVIPADERMSEDRRGDTAKLRHLSILSGHDWRDLPCPLPGRGQTGFRNYINGMAGARSKPHSVFGFRHRNPMRRFPEQIMALVLDRLFQALDLLHQECHIAHTDIQESKMLLGARADESVLREFEQEELNNPYPRKELERNTVYQSHELKQAKNFDALVLCDFGSAMRLDET
ncbi:hypothetical protein E4U09_007733 [Claviceps aff. purpurea]|uniref:Protein kinase domain-containing protein n=1 Tax=Claviceps aff. purpurea TaxID=1967640 RepID=A0A9P7TYW0_9HYPO|nr:hypothetical protein E4U09_007733 [Claviceps aff. purpurea]